MSTLQIVALICTILASGGFTSVIVELLKRATSLGKGTKLVLVGIISALVGLAVMWASGTGLDLVQHWGQVSAQDVWVYIGGVWAAAVAEYELLVRRLGLSQH